MFKKGKSGNPNGRPKGSLNKRTVLLEAIERHLPTDEAIMILSESARGIYREKTIKAGKGKVKTERVLVWKSPPNVDALTYLMNQAHGSPPKRVEVTGGEGGLPISIIYRKHPGSRKNGNGQ